MPYIWYVKNWCQGQIGQNLQQNQQEVQVEEESRSRRDRGCGTWFSESDAFCGS